MVYRTRVSIWLVIITSLFLFVPLYFIFEYGNTNGAIIGVACIVFSFLVLIDLGINIKYIIEGEKLRVRVGMFLKQDFDIAKMTEINKSRTILSAPAASLDRIEIRFGSDYPIVISPRQQREFIAQLLTINPNIKIDPRLTQTK